MGDGEKAPLRVQFNPKVCLEFHGATITSDAGLLPIRELDEALGLTDTADGYLQESRPSWETQTTRSRAGSRSSETTECMSG